MPRPFDYQSRIDEAQLERTFSIGGRKYNRLPHDGHGAGHNCRDCDVKDGQLHVLGCCVERCARCTTAQAFGCSCFMDTQH